MDSIWRRLKKTFRPVRVSLARRPPSSDVEEMSPRSKTQIEMTSSRQTFRCAGVALAAAALAALPAAATPTATVPPAPTGAALAILGKPPARTSIASQRIYFVIPDRYANGDPSNDRGGTTRGRAVTGHDPSGPGWFHGGDYRGLTGNCATPKRG